MIRKAFLAVAALMLALATPVIAAGCAGGESAAAQTTVAQTATTSAAEAATESVESAESAESTATASGETSAEAASVAVAMEAAYVTYDSEDEDSSWDASTAPQIVLAGDSARLEGAGATVEGSTITIVSAGTYVMIGTLDDGQVVVDSETEGTVRLVLNGADLTCSTSAPIHVKSADKTIITLADGTENSVTDGTAYTFDDTEAQEPSAAVFSKDDLTINGSGSLAVTANYNNGIASKDDLKITGGNITVEAANDGLKGRDCIGIKAGTVTVNAGGDGLQATNDEDTEKGYISIEGGLVNITAGTDGIQAQSTLAINGGEFTISTGGGSGNSSQAAGEPGNTFGHWGQGQDTADAATADSTSAKGLKAAGGVFVAGGTFDLDTSDDSIHSNGNVKIDGGTLNIASGDDGLHADGTLEINGGEIAIAQSYEGLESAVMTINDGTIHMVTSDDGINVAGGADSSSVSGRPGQNDFNVNENNQLYINGGYIAIDANGDALDCNGRIFMTDGVVILNGPTNDGNGAIDYMGEFTVSGGLLVAAGSSGMAEAPGETSSQNSIMVNLDQMQQAGTLVHIVSEDGDEILTMAPTKQYQSVVVSSPAIEQGATYKVYLGGSSTGTLADSLYSNGTYTPGTETVSLTIDGVLTTSGTAGMRGGMQGGGTSDGGTPPGRP